VNGALRASGGVVANARPVIRVAGTDYAGSDVSPTPAAAFQPRASPFWFSNPQSLGPWSNSDYNALEFGWEART
jgi:hypothetical protein